MLNAIKGFFIGIAMVIPGLSGSVFAIVLGVYEDMLFAVSDISKNFLKNFKYLFPIGIGIVLGIFLSVDIVLRITQRWSAFSFLFFAGLVAGSIPLVTKKIKTTNFKLKYLVGLILSFAFVYFITISSGASSEHISLYRINNMMDFLTVTFIGLVGVSLMALPGVSGSVILIMLGHFGTVYNSANELTIFISNFTRGNMELAVESLYTVFILVPFGIGALIGIISISKFITYILNKFEVAVYYCILGALISTIVVLIYIGVLQDISTTNLIELSLFLLSGLFWFFIGFLCTVFLDKKEDKNAVVRN
ncbi:MAG: DUF368 domain-containing protein [Defluviitaleaceae bacterium]|nr:DUF368 domain-containing protein [Defluviitaleaceae bacterium]